ncbi:MAG: iron-containing alcohol dehydrogenase, partial [Candidatus Aminicenantes bacterium]|nr:iron-containing alcohol dehydrogenase [Candidatus Aminicenantes bacterium]
VAAANPVPLRGHVEGAPFDRDPLPLVCLPTTSGTGSEVTPYAVFTDREGKNKTGYAHPRLFPSVALIDPELSYSMPPRVAIDTGLDVLAHAAEAFLSTLSFPLTDIIARQAIETVLAHLENAAAKIPEAMDEMSYAALLAGAAIAHAGTILPHIMGYPLTVFHGVPHGRASAVMLVHVLAALRFDNTRPEKFRALEDLFAPRGGLEAFLRGLGVPIRLTAYGVEEGEIPLYAGKTIVKGDIKITPAALTEDRLVAVYRSAL